MESKQTPSPLKEETPSQGWVIRQKKSSTNDLYWGCLEPQTSIQNCEGDEGESLYKKIKDQQGLLIDIPEHWLTLPTGLDMHTHLRFPGQTHKENLQGCKDAAILGGYDTLLAMPNTSPVLNNPTTISQAIQDAKNFEDSSLKLFFTGGILNRQELNPHSIKDLIQAGAKAITSDGWGIQDTELMEEILKQCEQENIIFLQHAEMDNHKGIASASPFQKENGFIEYPRTAESGMLKRDLQLLKKYPEVRYHIMHISTEETLKEITKAKEEGLKVTCEVTAHHLYFCNEDIPPSTKTGSTGFKMNPPLFSKKDQNTLQGALRTGIIDCLATDHAPHEREAKLHSWPDAPFGTRGLETALPVLLGLMNQEKLSYKRLVEVFSSKPRSILGTDSNPSGLLFVDPLEEFQVEESHLPGLSKNSCFLGSKLQGKIKLRAEPSKLFREETV